MSFVVMKELISGTHIVSASISVFMSCLSDGLSRKWLKIILICTFINNTIPKHIKDRHYAMNDFC